MAKAEQILQNKPPKKKAKPFFTTTKKVAVKLNEVPKKKETPEVVKKDATKKKAPKKEVKKIPNKKVAALALKKPVKEIEATSSKYQKHKDKEVVSKETKEASVLPAVKTNRVVANKHQIDLMNSQTTGKDPDPKKFDEIKFKKKIKDQINETAKSKAEAKKIKNNGVDDAVTENIGTSLEEEKTKVGGKVEQTTIPAGESPITPKDEVVSNEPIPLKPLVPPSKTLTAQRKTLAPKAKPKEETDFTKETKVLDDDYKKNNISQDKLQNSNEPRFIAADNQKQNSEAKAAELTAQQRAAEKKTIAKTSFANNKAINGTYNEMFTNNKNINADGFKNQNEKSKEETAIRNKVSTELDRIFDKTNKKVISCFKAIDDYINKDFSEMLTKALDTFSERVAQLLDDNDGIEWLGKKLTGTKVQSESEIFEIARKEFIDDMDRPIDLLVKEVDSKMNAAITAIYDGNKEKDTFWNSQDKETQQIAKDIKDDSDSKFTELESSVEAKEGAIIDTVSDKFTAALDELDERFEKAKLENMSWLDRAIAAVKAVINTIIELKNSLQAMAKKAAKYAARIIDAPLEFFGNLADGVGQGFSNFKKNIDKHLVKGVLEWLTGSMAGSEIILPKELNLEGITSLVLQILGITIKKIKGLVIDIIGKERFEFIEKGVDATIAAGNKILNIFQILNEKGLSGLWEFIKEEFSDLKEMLVENVKTFVIETITKKALEFLLSLLVPGGGFIRAAQMIIKFVVTLFQKAAQIIKIIDGIIDSFGDILNKNLAKAAEKVENVFSGFLSLAISFLAAILGLNGIVAKVQKFIQQKIRPKIDKVLKGIAKKIKEVVTKIGLTRLIDKSMKAVEKGKNWVDDKKKKAKDTAKKYGEKLLNWLGIKKKFKAVDGNMHTLFFEGSNKKPKLMIASDKMTFDLFINKITVDSEKKEAIAISAKINAILNDDVSKITDEKTRNSRIKENQNKINAYLERISKIASKYFKFSQLPVSKIHFDTISLGGGVMGKKMLAFPLTSNHPEGTESTEDKSNPAYNKIDKRGYKNGSFYVKGHLLNNNLGGPGSWINYTPLPGATFNTNVHYLKYEKPLKGAIEKQEIFYYKVEAIYKRSRPASTSSDTAIISDIKDGEITVPNAFNIEIFKYDFNADTRSYEKSKSQPNFAGKKSEDVVINNDAYYAKGTSTGVASKIYSLKGKSLMQLYKDGVDLDVAKKIIERQDKNLSITDYFNQIGVKKEILLNLIKRKDESYTDISQN
ncbi:hypothetical protein GOQ30_10775 [Flavobacterium sp. TP390]|uniref:DNA/RNA non-specific endonuclease n=1 Tax=Flavobacterium profundi TaxID=1774945 RepID=A0A6I4IJ74_9FLAO|nr:hypothetical protein [Flavobacterium profundi]MVO09644.1 hypothetical protein [Flavobacterium profundi]